jgi:NTP pyrophosphatase (non-canonical NTP hydrolase)
VPRSRPGQERGFRRLGQGQQDVDEELAETAIYLLGLAEMIGIDLQDEIEAKVEKKPLVPIGGCPTACWSN